MAGHARIGGRALATLLPDVHDLPGPVYLALARSVVALIVDGRVATETRLPSERELADTLRLSRATVTGAYDQLRTDGYLTSRTGAGSFVTVPPGSRPRTTLAHWPATATGVDEIDLSCAALPAPVGLLPDAVAEAAAALPAYTDGNGYDPLGLPVLREAIAARFSARGVPTGAEQILVTNGALHGLDLVLRLLVGPGERVVTELPTYPGALDAVRAHSGRIVPVPMAPGGGWQVDQLQAALRQTSARLAFLIPDFHNPTGALVPEADRRAVLRTARQTRTMVMVDESFVDLGFDGVTEVPTARLDPGVLTVGSLSKPVWGGLRIGWLRAAPELVNRLAALRTSIDMGSPVLDQLVAATVLGRIEEIAADRVAELQPRRDALAAALQARLPAWRFVLPRGGLSLWAEMDAPLCTPLAHLAAASGLVVVPGSRFGIDGTLERFVRLPFALPADRLVTAVDRLAAAREQLGGGRAPARPRVVA